MKHFKNVVSQMTTASRSHRLIIRELH